MKQDKMLDELMDEIKRAVREKEHAEKARVHAEQKKMKANNVLNLLMDTFRSKEYRL